MTDCNQLQTKYAVQCFPSGAYLYLIANDTLWGETQDIKKAVLHDSVEGAEYVIKHEAPSEEEGRYEVVPVQVPVPAPPLSDALGACLRAITARINGEFDHPYLLAYGLLDADPLVDIERIAKDGLQKVVAVGS